MNYQGSLPLHPSLASALALHGVQKSTASTLTNVQSQPSAKLLKRTGIQALTMHPSLPRVAYLAEETVSMSPSLPQSQQNTSSKRNKTASTASRSHGSAVKTQRIIIQQFHRKCARSTLKLHTDSSEKTNDVLACLPMEHLPLKLNRFRQTKSKNTKIASQPLTLASLGPLQSIEFLDREALFWQTRRGYGALTNGDITCISTSIPGKEEVIFHADSHFDGADQGLGYGLCLGLQFTRVLVILRFQDGPTKSIGSFTVLCCLEGQRPNSTGGKESNNQYTPTSALVPVTNSIVVYGCSDGAMRFHNLVPSLLYSSRNESMSSLAMSTSLSSSGAAKLQKYSRQTTIKSVRGPNGRNDPIVKILNVDPAYSSCNDIHHQKDESAAFTSNPNSIVLNSRLLTACSSGVAYLWDVHIRLDRASGAVRDLIVDPPLVRIDGLASLTVSPRKLPSMSGGKKVTSDGFWTDATLSKSASESDQDVESKAPYLDVTPAINYDYNRDLLIWALPSEAPAASIDHRSDFKLELAEINSPEAKKDAGDKLFLEKWSGSGENGGFVKVWNMSLVNALILRQSKSPPSTPQPPPKFSPTAVMKLHPFSASAASPSNVVGGLMIGTLTPTSLSYTCLSRDGSELIVQVAPLPIMASCIDKSWLVESSISSAPKKTSAVVERWKTFYVNFSTCYSASISSFQGKSATSTRVRGSSIAASFSSPNLFAVACDQGIIVGAVAEGETWYNETESLFLSSENPLSYNVPIGPLHTIISGGPVSSLNNRPGILFMEDNSLYASRLSTPRCPSDHKASLVEKIGLQDPMMMHVLHAQNKPWHKVLSTRISVFAEVRETRSSSPRLIPAPSGRYLCLFWEVEMRYEILHARSLLTKETGSSAGTSIKLDGRGPGVSPSVDSGSHVLSFAWIGDDDRFAILQYVDLISGRVADPSQNSPARVANFSPHSVDSRRKVLTRIISPSITDPRPLDENKPSSSPELGLIRPHVELKKLAEVEVDAVELAAGASVAAATTVDLGRLTLRGGDRSVPTVLFGGPALCVGCISISNRSNQPCVDNSYAYFYTRKNGAIKENDERASAYMTVGPEISYPSLVAWDEEGKLCAMALGSRVVVYLSQPPKFILLGAVRIFVTDHANAAVSLISLKFIHGVLYCSTQTSVHAIFLGNLEDEDSVCETDLFTIASNEVPICDTDIPDITRPVPAVTFLMQPHVLAYHCGGLLVSTTYGLRLLSLSHPIIRIGTLMGANLTEKARKWILATPESDHDAMAHFLIRRGRADLAISDLDGLSIESYIDLCMTHDHTDELEYLVEKDGSNLISQICNWKRGSPNGSYSAIFCLGVYFMGKGRMACAKKWTEIALNSGINAVVSDAMKLALFISAADRDEGNVLLKRAVDVIWFDTAGHVPFFNTA
ncbi:hypothetical protein ACHAW6_013521 [Cyclotella cf. meneghiniana]